MRLAIVTTMLSPYRNPVFADIGNRPGLDLLVITFSEDQAHRQWDMDSLYSENLFQHRRLSQHKDSFKVWRCLRKFDPDVVVLGAYDSRELCEALAFCKLHRKKAVLWSGSTKLSSRRQGIVGVARRAFIRSVDSFVAYGSKAREFLIHHGAAPEKIVIGYNTVDIGFFAERANELCNSQEYWALRNRIAPVSLLFVGQLIERKGFSSLIAALQRLHTVEFTLVVLGDGPLRQQLEAETQKYSFKIFFEGFRSTEELPLYYAACDIFVFPTLNDPWGLVVNEAMACGKPVVSSTEAGVSYDLVRHGANGWVVDPRNTEQLCNYLGKLIADNDLRRQMGETSSNIIQQFTPHALADAIVSASSLTGCQGERVSFAQGNS